jgi:hypothetical protein
MFRSRKLLNYAKGRACMLCLSRYDTVVAAHAPMEKGIGLKSSDVATAWLCGSCHDEIDGRKGRWSFDERIVMWTRAHIRTLDALFEEGKVKVV